MKANSKTAYINAPAYKVFGMAANCNHFGKYVPPQITNFTSTEEQCSFMLNNMLSVTLRITEKTPYTWVKFEAETDMKKEMNMEVRVSETGENSCTLDLYLFADIPIFLQPMVKGQLQTFVDKLAEKIKEQAEL